MTCDVEIDLLRDRQKGSSRKFGCAAKRTPRHYYWTETAEYAETNATCSVLVSLRNAIFETMTFDVKQSHGCRTCNYSVDTSYSWLSLLMEVGQSWLSGQSSFSLSQTPTAPWLILDIRRVAQVETETTADGTIDLARYRSIFFNQSLQVKTYNQLC